MMKDRLDPHGEFLAETEPLELAQHRGTRTKSGVDLTGELNDPNSPGNADRPEDAEYPPLPVSGEQQHEPDDSMDLVPDIIPNTDSGGVDTYSIMMTLLVLGLSAGAAYSYYWYRHKRQK